MDKLEEYLQKNAIYTTEEKDVKIVKIEEILQEYALEPLSSGLNTRAFRIKDQPWVIKEGRWDMDMQLIGDLKLNIPRVTTEKMLQFFEVNFSPDIKEVLRQYKLYLSFVNYFGYFANPKQYYHPQLSPMQQAQRKIREALLNEVGNVEDYYKMRIDKKIFEVFDEDILMHNFLPKEYLLYGNPISKENNERNTYYIFQEYVEGKHLHDFKGAKLDGKVNEQLAMLSYLILYMRMKENFVPDTRPRYMLLELDWLAKTDNVILSEQGAKFIDTRWLWDTTDNFVKRGFLIPDFTINNAKKYLNKYLGECPFGYAQGPPPVTVT